MNIKTKKTALLLSMFLLLATSCKKELATSPTASKKLDFPINGNFYVTPYAFNWETVNWMPTPAGQAQIPPPWIGQGSIASLYGTDIVNDHKASDGWELVYNTFDPNAPGSLVNPYFILYNRYRGLMRIYLYITTQFVSPSSYMVDGLKVVSNSGSSMLNFLGTDMVDPSQNQPSFTQIEAAPGDGSLPLASNKWYMLQYEMAYDPQTANKQYQDILLSWFVNYNSVSTISLGGTEVGTIKSVVGAPSDPLDAALKNGGTVAGTAAVSFIGNNVVNNLSQTGTPNNKVGLPDDSFSRIKSAIGGALSAATGNIPGAIVGIFSAIIGGTSDSTPTLNLNLNSTITLNGTQSSAGSFPSSPTSVYVPGSVITQSAQNYIPLYNKTLGLFNVAYKPTVNATIYSTRGYDGYYTIAYDLASHVDQFFITNPAVINSDPNTGAQIQNINALLVLVDVNTLYNFQSTGNIENVGSHTVCAQTLDAYGDPVSLSVEYATSAAPYFNPNPNIGVRISFDVVPNNGSPKSTIVKTFLANVQTIHQ